MLMDKTNDFKVQNKSLTCIMDEVDVYLVDDDWN